MKDIRNIPKKELEAFIKENKAPMFRVQQIENWLWRNFVGSFDEMLNIPAQLRTLLKKHYTLTVFQTEKISESPDGTLKVLVSFYDKAMVEAVLIPESQRVTVCISTQVGCPGACAFCATASMGFKRNLTKAEIYAQVMLLQEIAESRLNRSISNVVIMGMGEPLLNYNAVADFCNMISSENGLHISAQKITLSSVGIPEKIERMADDNVRCKLAISLHAATNEKRDKIIPLNKKHPLPQLMKSLNYYYSISHKEITFEYLLLKGFNDSREDAEALVKLCRKVPSKVNLIAFNSFPGANYERSPDLVMSDFMAVLEAGRINVRLRKSRGGSINAACGQLLH